MAATVTETPYTALVRGPAALYPRGGLWIFLVWYTVGYLAFLFGAKPSQSFAIALFAFYAIGASAVTWVLGRTAIPGFEISSTGIVLGRSGMIRELPSSDVQQIRISAVKHGVLLEIMLGPSVRVRYRGLARQLGI